MSKRIGSIVAVGALIATSIQAMAQVVDDVAALSDGQAITHGISEGSLIIQFDRELFGDLGWSVYESSLSDSVQGDLHLSYPLDASVATVTVEGRRVTAASVASSGGMLLVGKNGQASLGNLTLTSGATGGWSLRSTLGDSGATPLSFELSTVGVEYLDGTGRFRLSGDLLLTESTATALGRPDLEQITVGWVQVEGLAGAVTAAGEAGRGAQECTAGLWPDVIVGDLPSFASYGSSGGISAFAVATTSCNIGTCQLNWFANNNQHPVIGQNLYRLKDGRLEQIGQSWLKHGFFALSHTLCSSDCVGDPSGQHLGVNCSDPYSAGLNGSQSNLGPRSEVNATTGEYPFPFGSPAVDPTIGRRLQVHNDDLNPDLNAGARYFVEGHYISNDDALENQGGNNASYRAVLVTGTEPTYSLARVPGVDTQRQRPAIMAWAAADPDVRIYEIRVPNEGGVLRLAAKASNNGDGTFRYEYAIHNLNSHESVFSFSMPLGRDTIVTNMGFHDVDSHSGEPYSNDDWIATHDAAANTVTWETESFAQNSAANAIRWGTMYNFWFDADSGPMNASIVTLGKYRLGEYYTRNGVMGPQTGASMPVSCGAVANRSLSICATGGGVRASVQALRLTVLNAPGVVKWLAGPDASGYSRLVCNPVFRNWGSGTILVADRDIVPAASYKIQSLLDGADPGNEDNYSTPLSIATVPLWGDAVGEFVGGVWTAANGLVNFQDIDASVLAFQAVPNAPSVARMDLHDEVPNGLINFNDIAQFILAFQGGGYPYGDPVPCP